MTDTTPLKTAALSSSSAPDSVDVREVESPSAIYKSIPKVKGAPYVAGLEPLQYGELAPLNHQYRDEDGNPVNLDPNARYYQSSTRVLGLLFLLLAAALLGLWSYNYNQEPRFIATNQKGAQSSFQEASLGEEEEVVKKTAGKKSSANNNNKKAKSRPGTVPQKQKQRQQKQQQRDQQAPIRTAPDAVGLWSNVEFSLDKIRSVETLKGFALVDKDDVFEWLAHPISADAFFQCFAVFVLTVASITIARAIPAFMIFCCVGISILGWIATLGDLFLVGSALRCFQTEEVAMAAATTNSGRNNNNNNNNVFASVVSAKGCSFPMIMHAFCVNTKWFCLVAATSILIISIRLRGGLKTGFFGRYINMSVLAGLPVCAQGLRFYLWYTGLGVVKDAVGPEHGWILPHHEELIAMSFHVSVFIQAGLWVLFGFALFSQETLLVLEEEKPEEKEPHVHIKGLHDGGLEKEEKATAEVRKQVEKEEKEKEEAEAGKRSWKKGENVRQNMQKPGKGKGSNNKKDEKK